MVALSEHPIWHRLVKYHSGKSQINSMSFFIAKQGKTNPYKELQATLEGYDKLWGSEPNKHPRCRFPARYYWLSKQLNLPNFTTQPKQCTRLLRWARIEDVKSVSLLLVSGFFDNPASIFGHSLIKLNTDSSDDPKGLFDMTVNYGALVSDKEPGLLYVFRGLLGGYEAGFSNQYYYSQDVIYSKKELRDMWEYELQLSEEKKVFLILHLWELLAKKTDYLFLSDNCAYRMAEALELVVDVPISSYRSGWYAPVEMFNYIEKLNRNDRLGIEKTYTPSAQREFHRTLSSLKANEAHFIKQFVDSDQIRFSEGFDVFSQAAKVKILNTLIQYYDLEILAVFDELEKQKRLKEKQQQVFIKRFELPKEKSFFRLRKNHLRRRTARQKAFLCHGQMTMLSS